jgi:hypothetical protein
MNNKTVLVIGLVLVLISCVFFSGCADNSDSSNTTTTVTSAPGSPKYVTGDIVKNPAYETAWLILGYNTSTDSYQRALIYANADGSWGYRTSSNSETVTRAVFEKTNTVKITNKPPSSIVIRKPTTVATTRTTVTTSTTGNTTTTTTTTTTNTTVTGKPTFKKIIPDEGNAGSTITITSLTGTNFKSGAIVQLTKEDNTNITATNVEVQSPTLMTCKFVIPSNTTAGAWDVVITNTDGQFVKYAYIFSIHATVDTSTTTQSDTEGISSVSPTFTLGNFVVMTITGTGFQQGSTLKAKLTKSTGAKTLIAATDTRWDSSTQVTAWFNIAKGSKGVWTVVVTNPDGTTRTLTNGFEVKV